MLISPRPQLRRVSSRLRRGDRGAAVVEFSLVAVLLVAIFMVVLQVGIYIHERNVMAASAQAAARYAANANVSSSEGADRAKTLIAQALSVKAARGLTCTATEVTGDGGVVVVQVRCVGAIPTIVSGLGDVLSVNVVGRAIKEGL